MNADVIKVGNSSPVGKVSGSITKSLLNKEVIHTEVRAIGAGAVNQAVKSIAVSRKQLKKDELDISSVINLIEVEENGGTVTVVSIDLYLTSLT